jgi:hypothetical protein
MSKFDKLYSKAHVKNHPWFQDMGTRVEGMRQALQKKSDAEFSLHDVFSEKRQVGLKSGDRTLNAYIQEAAITAREALNSFDFPIRPEIAYNNSRRVKFASHDPSQVVEAEILFNVRIATVSGVFKTATLPLKVISGMVVPPSVIVYDGRFKTLGQAVVDEIVQRHTSYSLQPMRGMFSPPMTYQELETAVAAKNEMGYQPREFTPESKGVRRTNSRHLQGETPEGDKDAGLGNMVDWAGDQVAGWRDKQRNKFNESGLGKLWNYGVQGPYEPNYHMRQRNQEKYDKIQKNAPAEEVDYGGPLPPVPEELTVDSGDIIPEDDGMSWMDDEDESAVPSRSVARKRSEMDPEVSRWYKMYQAAGNSPEDAIDMAKEQAAKMNTKTSRRVDKKVAQAAESVNPWAETGVWDFNAPGEGSKAPLQSAPDEAESQTSDVSSDDTSFLYGEILANKDIMRMLVDAMAPSVDQVANNIFEAVSPLVESLHLDADRIDWYSLSEDLQGFLGSNRQAGARITKVEARKVAFVTAEYLMLRRRFGYRCAGAAGQSELDSWQRYVDESGEVLDSQTKAFATQILDKARSYVEADDDTTAHDLLEQLRPHFDTGGPALTDADVPEAGAFQQSEFQDPGAFLQDAPEDSNQDPETFFQPGEAVPKKLWGSLMARLERHARIVKVAGGTPLGYLEVVDAMLEAEEAGLDTFPRPFIHVARNYIMAHTNTASQNMWMPHLINDGFVINPLGVNRGRMRRMNSRRQVSYSFELRQKVDALHEKYWSAGSEAEAQQVLAEIEALGPEATDYFYEKADYESGEDLMGYGIEARKVAVSPVIQRQVDQLLKQYMSAEDEEMADNIVSQIFDLGEEAADYFNSKTDMDLPGESEMSMDELKYAQKKVAISPKEKALVDRLYKKWNETDPNDEVANDAIYSQLEQLGEASFFYWENLMTEDEVEGDTGGGDDMSEEEWDSYSVDHLGAPPKADSPDEYEPRNKVKWALSRNRRR